MPDDIGGSERMLAQWEQSIQQKAARYQSMAERVQELTITETSRDGLIRLTIGSNGILSSVDIAEPAREKRMSEVSGEIMRCLQRAQSRIPELLQQVMAETIGTQDETANVLFAEARKNFPAAPAEEPAPSVHEEMRFGIEDDPQAPPPPPAPRPQRPQRRPSDDDDFDGGSFLS
ncbi:YbaB/EbfC family nucleoid-associated protein [Umezawaea sp. Da 62-37]|uniref:YbaB/EbfC family nucleoid-associated protein n=1 Tax=Umezawaea sp. Da 62-37 TaxID=3075927 RepID=UPI0028F6EBA1|nr:YbaB/EbfC family nucleoid-associated protein [Umezawaea sp. Da 62-37]WNV89511.1 YbaB/EbfC family nucleoid-associated protein [Umezawaea sp. Da 62-37]